MSDDRHACREYRRALSRVWRSTRVITRSGVAADHRADFGGRSANPVFMLSDARPWPSVPGSARRSLIGAVAGVYPVPHMAGLADPSHHPVPLHRAGSPRSGSPPVLVEQTCPVNVNRKVVGSSPSSGAISELESALKRHTRAPIDGGTDGEISAVAGVGSTVGRLMSRRRDACGTLRCMLSQSGLRGVWPESVQSDSVSTLAAP
jgi:hypothetical protein